MYPSRCPSKTGQETKLNLAGRCWSCLQYSSKISQCERVFVCLVYYVYYVYALQFFTLTGPAESGGWIIVCWTLFPSILPKSTLFLLLTTFYKMKTCSAPGVFFRTSKFKSVPFTSIKSAFVGQNAFATPDNHRCGSHPILGCASDCSGHPDRLSLTRWCWVSLLSPIPTALYCQARPWRVVRVNISLQILFPPQWRGDSNWQQPDELFS